MNWRFWLSDKLFANLRSYLYTISDKIVARDPSFLQGKIYVDIRGGLPREGGQMRVGWSQMAIFASFARYYLRNLHIQGHNYYIVVCSPLMALHWRRNGWHWMTLNGHFALKSGPSSESNGLAFWLSEKKLFGNLQSYAYNCQRNKNVAQRLYWW